MKKQDISAKKNIIASAINDGQLAVAFKQLRQLSELLMTWEITDEISRIEESYKYMLDYALRGVSDPSRPVMYKDITNRMRLLLDNLERKALTNDAPTLYFNTVRYTNLHDRESIAHKIKLYETLNRDYWTTGANLSPKSAASTENRLRREQLEKDIFTRLWITMPLSRDDYSAISDVIKAQTFSSYFKQLIISGLLLGMLEYYDSKRLLLMIDAYETGDETISPIACIALLLSLYTYRNRPLDETVIARIKLLNDNKHWHNDLRDAFLELVRTRDTERITRTMQDEVVPEMMKLRPEINKRFGSIENIEGEITDFDMNPEWQEMLEKSGIADKIKQLFDIQLEGGDVFMATFAHLKAFPFFNDISNWFLPFHSGNSVALQVPDELADIATILESTPVFCNSDKYSLMLSLQNIPANQRDLFKAQINSQIDGIIEMQKSSLNNDKIARGQIMNRYVQDLYRFFRLFRRKGEFNDPFSTDLNLVTISAINGMFKDVNSLLAIAEFFFKHQYYVDALNIFKAIEQISCPDIQLFEKMGYCYERTNNYRQALQYYEQAELLNANSLWTLRHLALCHRMLGNHKQALNYYKTIETTDESVSTLMAIGNCYLEMENYKEAIKYYYKVNYLDDKKQRARRQLAWALMMTRDFDKASDLYDIILNDNPSDTDYLNMGHLALAKSDKDNAINYYKLSIAQSNDNLDKFAEKLKADSNAFTTMGLAPDIIPLIIDAIRYSRN